MNCYWEKKDLKKVVIFILSHKGNKRCWRLRLKEHGTRNPLALQEEGCQKKKRGGREQERDRQESVALADTAVQERAPVQRKSRLMVFVIHPDGDAPSLRCSLVKKVDISSFLNFSGIEMTIASMKSYRRRALSSRGEAKSCSGFCLSGPESSISV